MSILSMTEAALQSKLIKDAKVNHGWPAFKIEWPGNAGGPDVLILVPGSAKKGRAVFVEVKRLGREPTPLQEHFLMEIRRAGFIALWGDDVFGIISRIYKELAARP